MLWAICWIGNNHMWAALTALCFNLIVHYQKTAALAFSEGIKKIPLAGMWKMSHIL